MMYGYINSLFLYLRPEAAIPQHTTLNDHFTSMNWVQVQSWLLSDAVQGLFLNGAPIALCPVFSLQVDPVHIGQHYFPSGMRNVFFGYFMAATRMLSAVKTCLFERKKRSENQSKGRDSQYDTPTMVMGNSTSISFSAFQFTS